MEQRPSPANLEAMSCSKPFTWFEVSGTGDVYLCCPSWLDTSIGNLGSHSVQDVWNGPVAQDIRRSILDGSFSYCNAARCPYLQSVRTGSARIEGVTNPDLRAVIEGGLTVLPYGPRDVNCCFDRSCNLSCPSCRTSLLVETHRRDEILSLQQRISDEALVDARLLYITGSGDPFGSPFFRQWLRTMRVEDMPHLEIIHLHTNGLLWNPAMWSSIPAPTRALVRYADISIDAATPETYAVNRRVGGSRSCHAISSSSHRSGATARLPGSASIWSCRRTTSRRWRARRPRDATGRRHRVLPPARQLGYVHRRGVRAAGCPPPVAPETWRATRDAS